jgi:aryl-alcohol dehydrogenase-like predicted oxidoreductase
LTSAAGAERSLGRTALRVSRLGLGLAAVGRPGYINLGRARDLPAERTPAALAARTTSLLDAARAVGIRYVDAARSYGRAEEFVAAWLRERAPARDALTIGSKWGYRYTAGWSVDAAVHEEKELSPARFTQQLAESRALLLLGTWLDLYQIHSATAESGCLTDEKLLRLLVERRRAGDYRAVGLTLTGPNAARALDLALAARLDGERVFDTVQATFNCLEPSLGDGLAAAHDAGLGVIAKEVFANGRLTDAEASRDATLAPLAALARTRGIGTDQLALAWVLAHPFIDCALSGAATTEQLASHVAATQVSLDASERAACTAAAMSPAAYWERRARLDWS